MQEAAQQPILIKRTFSLAEKSGFRGINCSFRHSDRDFSNHGHAGMAAGKGTSLLQIIYLTKAVQGVKVDPQAAHDRLRGDEAAFPEPARGHDARPHAGRGDRGEEVALAALQLADSKLQRLDRPQFLPLRRAIARDMDRLKGVPYVDVAGISIKLDQLTGAIDSLPLAKDDS